MLVGGEQVSTNVTPCLAHLGRPLAAELVELLLEALALHGDALGEEGGGGGKGRKGNNGGGGSGVVKRSMTAIQHIQEKRSLTVMLFQLSRSSG